MAEREKFNCRYCLEDFEDRDDIISPCDCKGTQAFVCKTCFNSYINTDRNNVKYTTCPSCKFLYDRKGAKVTKEINDETRDEALYAVSVLTLLTILLLVTAKFTILFIFILIFVYFYTISVGVHLLPFSYNYSIYAVLIIYLLILWTPKKISYPLFSLWIIGIFGVVSYRMLNELWEKVNKIKVSKLNSENGCEMFDFNLNRYVGGVI